MKKVPVIVLLVSVVVVTAFSQKTSRNNYTGAWENNASWTTAPAPDNIIDTELDLTINGYITRNGNLDVRGAIATQNFVINDTLVIIGSVDFRNDAAELVIGPNGVLIVIGNMDFGNNTRVTNGGIFAVSGAVDFAPGASDIYDNSGGGEFFVQGDVTNNPNAQAADDWNNLDTRYAEIYEFIQCGGVAPCTLPVKLAYFNVALRNEMVELKWATIMEENFQKFVIQRSADGVQFEEIGELKGKGFNIYDIETKYSFVDASPLVDVNYYRLKAVDLDDSFEYFQVKMIRVEGARVISAYPNPSSGQVISFRFNFNPQESDRIVLIDQLGTEIYNTPASEVHNSIVFQEPLAPGIYMLKVRSGHAEQVTRVLIRN